MNHMMFTVAVLFAQSIVYIFWSLKSREASIFFILGTFSGVMVCFLNGTTAGEGRKFERDKRGGGTLCGGARASFVT